MEGKWKFEIPKEGYSSSIQLRTYHLYKKDLSEFELDDIRFMIVQKVGLDHLVPIALNFLKENLLTEAYYYEGDLLHSLLLIPKSFWEGNTALYKEALNVLLSNKDQLATLNVRYDVDKKLLQAYEQFIVNQLNIG